MKVTHIRPPAVKCIRLRKDVLAPADKREAKPLAGGQSDGYGAQLNLTPRGLPRTLTLGCSRRRKAPWLRSSLRIKLIN